MMEAQPAQEIDVDALERDIAGFLRCSVCRNLLPRSRFATKQRNRGDFRRCGDCLAGVWARDLVTQEEAPQQGNALQVRPQQEEHEHPASVRVAAMIQQVISAEQKDDFLKFMLTAAEDVKKVGESTKDEVSDYDILLKACPQFPEFCRAHVDPETMLYPLQKAIEVKRAWEKGVRQIYEACPEVIGFPHPKTGLFPFQVAAERGDLELTYHLLKANATIVKEPIRDPCAMMHHASHGSALLVEEAPMSSIYREQSGQSTVYVYSSMEFDCEDDDEQNGMEVDDA